MYEAKVKDSIGGNYFVVGDKKTEILNQIKKQGMKLEWIRKSKTLRWFKA